MNSRQESEIEITPEMIEAGVARLSEMEESGSAYTVEEVFLAMARLRGQSRAAETNR